MKSSLEIEAAILQAFGPHPGPPALSLRGGAALDLYDLPPPFDPTLDAPTEEYLERFCAGLAHLDSDSWLYYLPLVLRLAWVRASQPGDPLVEAVLWALRPPDRDPPRSWSISRSLRSRGIRSSRFRCSRSTGSSPALCIGRPSLGGGWPRERGTFMGARKLDPPEVRPWDRSDSYSSALPFS